MGLLSIHATDSVCSSIFTFQNREKNLTQKVSQQTSHTLFKTSESQNKVRVAAVKTSLCKVNTAKDSIIIQTYKSCGSVFMSSQYLLLLSKPLSQPGVTPGKNENTNGQTASEYAYSNISTQNTVQSLTILFPII